FSSVSELLPLFPLGSVLFPGALLPLHIFEPRYRLLIRRSVERERPFGIVLIRSGAEVGPAAVPHAIGTEARIVAVSRLADGRSGGATVAARDAERVRAARRRDAHSPPRDRSTGRSARSITCPGRAPGAELATTRSRTAPRRR